MKASERDATHSILDLGLLEKITVNEMIAKADRAIVEGRAFWRVIISYGGKIAAVEPSDPSDQKQAARQYINDHHYWYMDLIDDSGSDTVAELYAVLKLVAETDKGHWMVDRDIYNGGLTAREPRMEKL